MVFSFLTIGYLRLKRPYKVGNKWGDVLEEFRVESVLMFALFSDEVAVFELVEDGVDVMETLGKDIIVDTSFGSNKVDYWYVETVNSIFTHEFKVERDVLAEEDAAPDAVQDNELLGFLGCQTVVG